VWVIFVSGGITTLVDMPLNSFPSTVSEETLKMKVRFLCQLQVPYTVATHFMSVIDTAITSLTFSWKQLKISYMLMLVSSPTETLKPKVFLFLVFQIETPYKT
jgi:dihydroorotase-like cyclic amidohydrolase